MSLSRTINPTSYRSEELNIVCTVSSGNGQDGLAIACYEVRDVFGLMFHNSRLA